MWLFLRRRLIIWVVLAVGVPLLDWLLGKVSETLRARQGESTLTRGRVFPFFRLLRQYL